MKSAAVADLRTCCPSVYRWIADGETIELTRGGKVVARIVPTPKERKRKFKMPDFAAMRREVFGKGSAPLSAEDSAFIRQRGDR